MSELPNQAGFVLAKLTEEDLEQLIADCTTPLLRMMLVKLYKTAVQQKEPIVIVDKVGPGR